MTPSKTAMVCKLAQIPPEIWKSLLAIDEKMVIE
jgi:hypothetical protein